VTACGALQTVSKPLIIVGLGLFGGLTGSLVDSVLGALLQFSGYNENEDAVVSQDGTGVHHISGINLLSNNQVNFLSATITAVLTAWLAWMWL
jgi:uncharacterized membrane protein